MVKITIAARKMSRAPKRSATQALTGMNTARLSRYDVIARLSLIGSSCNERAIAGSAVVITVESSSSMNRAQPTISGTRTSVNSASGSSKPEAGVKGVCSTGWEDTGLCGKRAKSEPTSSGGLEACRGYHHAPMHRDSEQAPLCQYL